MVFPARRVAPPFRRYGNQHAIPHVAPPDPARTTLKDDATVAFPTLRAVAQPSHIPVLAERILEILAPQPGETVLDCTAGAGGHAVLFARAIGPTGTLILNDLDEENLRRASERVGREAAPESGGVWEGRIVGLHGNFAAAPRRIAELATGAAAPEGQARRHPSGGVDVLLADLGFESGQIEDPARGLAFSREGPLDMRYDRSRGSTAAELVNTLSVRELAEIIRDYGEEPHGVARRIAEKLVQERAREPIQTTARFAQIVREGIGRTRSGKIDAATRTFQAMRIAVNDELSALDALLEHIERAARALRLPGDTRAGAHPGEVGGRGGWLNPGARVGIIAFHSLEDRRVKRAFAGLIEQHAAVHLAHRPVEADETEQRLNPRSRSARFRAVRLGP